MFKYLIDKWEYKSIWIFLKALTSIILKWRNYKRKRLVSYTMPWAHADATVVYIQVTTTRLINYS